MLCELAVERLIDVIEHKVQQIETGDERRREVDVARYGLFWVVFGPDRVRGGKNGRPRVEGRDDACLGNGDRLLFLWNLT